MQPPRMPRVSPCCSPACSLACRRRSHAPPLCSAGGCVPRAAPAPLPAGRHRSLPLPAAPVVWNTADHAVGTGPALQPWPGSGLSVRSPWGCSLPRSRGRGSGTAVSGHFRLHDWHRFFHGVQWLVVVAGRATCKQASSVGEDPSWKPSLGTGSSGYAQVQFKNRI